MAFIIGTIYGFLFACIATLIMSIGKSEKNKD
jgi:hypothetical protein